MDPPSPHQLIKNIVKVGPPLTKLFGSNLAVRNLFLLPQSDFDIIVIFSITFSICALSHFRHLLQFQSALLRDFFWSATLFFNGEILPFYSKILQIIYCILLDPLTTCIFCKIWS